MSSDAAATHDRPYSTPEAPRFTIEPDKGGRHWVARLEHGDRTVSEFIPLGTIARLQRPGREDEFRCYAAKVVVRLHKRLRAVLDGRTNA